MTESTHEQENVATEDTAVADTTKVIEVQNPTAEELAGISEAIKANFDFNVNVKPTVFNFKKSKDKDTGVEIVRKPVHLAIPYPSVQGIIDILEKGGKGLELLLDATETIINQQARELLYDDTSLTAATFPVEKCSWEFISNIPKVQRKGGGIPKEVWEAFAVDYVSIMPEAAGKTVDQVTTMSKILLNKLASVKTNEPVLNLVIEQLGIYAESSENFEEFSECVAFLLNKAESFLNVSPEDLLANL